MFFHFLFYNTPGEKSSVFSVFRSLFDRVFPLGRKSLKIRIFSPALLTRYE